MGYAGRRPALANIPTREEMDKLLKDIRAAIEAAAAKEQGLPPWQAAQEIADNCEVAARWVEMYEMGRPAGAILTDLAREQEKAWEIIKGETKSYRENARRNNPEFPDGMFSTKCAAIAMPLIAAYIQALITGDNTPITRAVCTTEGLKQDISELCQDCPLPGLIKEGIEQRTIAQAEALQHALPPAQFKAYLSREIEAAAKALATLMQLAQRPGALFPNITKQFLWNKERIKALQAFLQPEAAKPGQPAAYGEGLADVVRDALEKRRLLDGGKFAGQTSPHVKALFAVLRQKGYLPKKSRIQAARMLSSLFASEFGFEFAARTISTAETQKSLGQVKAENLFLKDIPEKK